MLDASAASYALLLGAVAAFNPCGFALLPAYVTLIVTGSADSAVARPVALRRGVAFALAMTLGFLVLFTGVGLLFGAVRLSLQGSILPYVSYITVAIGILLVGLGVLVVVRGEPWGPRLHMRLSAPRATFWSQVGYGAGFAVASLSCTIGLFLAVVSQALVATNPLGVVLPFVIYGIGMGASVMAVTLLAVVAGTGLMAALRNNTRLIMRVGGVLIILAGLYVVVFGLAEILPRYGIEVLNPVLLTTARWQSVVTEAIQSWGTPLLVAVVMAVAALAIWVHRRGSGDSGAQADIEDGVAPRS